MSTMTSSTLTEQQILGAVEGLKREAVDMLCELVGYPSLLGDEASAQAAMARRFGQLGLKVDEFEIDEDAIRRHPGYSPSLISYEGRRNVVGVHQPAGAATGRSLILNGHIDVVPIGHPRLWTTPPFEARVDGDRLYGRGACDMKAGIVAYTMAFTALRKLGFEPAAPLYLQSVIEEECTGNGALACLVAGYTADAALIPEPSGECVVTAQIGVMWMAIDVFGVPVHASRASEGIAATAFAQYLVDELRALERQWNEPAARHPMYREHAHPINFNLGKLAGGEWASSVPTHCRADLRIGYYPGKKVPEVQAEIEALLKAAHARHPHAANVRYEISLPGLPVRRTGGRHERAGDHHARPVPPGPAEDTARPDGHDGDDRREVLPPVRQDPVDLLRPRRREPARHRRMGFDRKHAARRRRLCLVHRPLVRIEPARLTIAALPDD